MSGDGECKRSVPGSFSSAAEMSFTHSSHFRGTEKVASYVGSILFAAGAVLEEE